MKIDKPHGNLLDYVACTVDSGTDTTYRHEAALVQIELFENMVRNCAVAMFAIDAKHRVIYWNRACEELTGIPGSRILGTTDQWTPFYESRRPTVSDIVVDGEPDRMKDLYTVYSPSLLIPNGLHAEGWYSGLGGKRRYLIFDASPVCHSNGELLGAVQTLQDITRLKQIEEEQERLNVELKEALNQIKTLSGLIPICAACKKIRDDKGYWNQLEQYLEEHSDAVFSHGLCPECFREYFPEAAKPRKE